MKEIILLKDMGGNWLKEDLIPLLLEQERSRY